MSVFPASFEIGKTGEWVKMPVEALDADARGIFWMWEPPSKAEEYFMGMDPTRGITNWNRITRQKDDERIDNAALTIFRKGRGTAPDVQVAEYAAPVDPVDFGDIGNMAGRVYSGKEGDQCCCILETTGIGSLTLQRMIALGYGNFWQHQYYGNTVATDTRSIVFGSQANQRSVLDLWVRSMHHIVSRKAVIKSPWLVEEYRDCHINLQGWGEASPPAHDDRVRAANLALWAANPWTEELDRTREEVRTDRQRQQWANTDMTMEEIQEAWAERFA